MILYLIFLFSSLNAQIITEFQAIQSDTEPEWIEIYNMTNEDLFLDSFRIADNLSSISIGPVFLNANSFKVFTQNKLQLEKHYKINSEFIVEAKFPVLNNTTDEIKIYNGSKLLDSLYYDTKWFDNRNSVEKIDFFEPPTKENLTNSIAKYGGTPLDYNSNRIYKFDLKVNLKEIRNDSILIEVLNIGREKIKKFDYEVYLDLNRDGNFDFMELIYSRIDNEIDSNWLYRNYKYDLMENFDIYGAFDLMVRIVSDIDDNRNNDTLKIKANFSPRRGSILINEIMFEPDRTNCEYVEIYSDSNFDININDLFLHDRQNEFGNGVRFNVDYVLKSKDYFVIAADSNIFNSYRGKILKEKVYVANRNLSLNIAGDRVVLKWSDGYVIDEMEYFPNWHNPNLFNTRNISLEKKKVNLISNEKQNWTSSSDNLGGTPTYPNSYVYDITKDYGIKLPQNPFSFIEQEVIKIAFSTPFENSLINLSIFSKQGAKLGMITELEYSSSSGEIMWNGKLNNRQLRSGTYVLYLESVKRDSQEIYTAKEVIVIVNSN
jgi:hypothetical protein